MDNEIPLPGRTLRIHGKIRISCGEDGFFMNFMEGRTLVEFRSFSRLLRMKSHINSLRDSIKRLPPLAATLPPEKAIAVPKIEIDLPDFRLTVRGRSIGKLEFKNGSVQFHLTPFDFITKRMF